MEAVSRLNERLTRAGTFRLKRSFYHNTLSTLRHTATQDVVRRDVNDLATRLDMSNPGCKEAPISPNQMGLGRVCEQTVNIEWEKNMPIDSLTVAMPAYDSELERRLGAGEIKVKEYARAGDATRMTINAFLSSGNFILSRSKANDLLIKASNLPAMLMLSFNIICIVLVTLAVLT